MYVQCGFHMKKEGLNLVDLMVEVHSLSRRAAIAVLKNYTPAGRVYLMEQLRKMKLEKEGQQRLDVGGFVYPELPAKAKKVPYTLLLPPAMLEAIKDAVALNGLPMSQFIRNAIEKELRSRR
jgi:predicted DNA binding CopG/RHH family protein